MKELPEKYNISITIQAADGSGVKVQADLQDVLRTDIFDPSYENRGITALVRMLEESSL